MTNPLIRPLAPLGLVPQGRMLPALPPVRAQRQSATRSTLVGVLTGAALGSIIFFAQADEDCSSGESMCGLALPAYAGAGALAGGMIGFVFSISTR